MAGDQIHGRVDYPDGPATAIQILVNFPDHVQSGISGRNHLYGKRWSAVDRRCVDIQILDPICGEKRNVGLAHGIYGETKIIFMYDRSGYAQLRNR